MKIKVCGLKYQDNIKAVAALSPDYMGFIWYDQSMRFVGGLLPDVMASLPITTQKIAVFVNADNVSIDSIIDRYKFDGVQLHGSESADFCKYFKDKVEVLKAFGIDENFDFGQLETYVGSVDYFLFDTKTPKHGGSGKIFNWDVLQKYKLNVPFFLSGGLSLDNLAEVEKIQHPMFYGVDLNSRFETEPGIKDITPLTKAFDTLRKTAQ